MIRENVKALWRLCFDDDETFIELYFRLRYNNEVNIAITSGEEVIAALQMLPYPMTFCGKTIQTSYVSGACTHPDFQGKGVMRELLSQAFIRMLRNDAAISTLIPGEPWLFSYYARMGYAPVFQYSKVVFPSYKELDSTDITIEQTVDFEESAYEYFNEQMEERDCCIQHTAADFKVILADLAASHGSLYIARNEGETVGMAIAYPKEEVVQLAELFAENSEVERQIIQYIQQATGCHTVTLFVPPIDQMEICPLGMARIIDAKSILQLYAAAYPQDEMSIELTDEQVSSNSGHYYLYSGKCMYNKERLPGVHLQLTIGELSEKILAPLRPYMNLMLN